MLGMQNDANVKETELDKVQRVIQSQMARNYKYKSEKKFPTLVGMNTYYTHASLFGPK